MIYSFRDMETFEILSYEAPQKIKKSDPWVFPVV